MHLVEILLPLFAPDGTPFGRDMFQRVMDELTQHHGGVTAFTRAPAEGRWSDRGAEVHDRIVVFEVMVDAVDRSWWRNYREELQRRFAQDEVVIRAHPIERL